MALRIRSGFTKFLKTPQESEASRYLALLRNARSDDVAEAQFWRFPGAAVDVQKGYLTSEAVASMCSQKVVASRGKKDNLVSFLLVRRSPEEEETWKISFVFSGVPHVKARFIDRNTGEGLTNELPLREAVRLVEDDVADVVVRNEEFIGTPMFLYLDRKMSRSKKLSAYRDASIWSGTHILSLLWGTIETEIANKDNNLIVLPKNEQSVASFLGNYDERLVACLGPSRMESLLAPLGLSLKGWLDC